MNNTTTMTTTNQIQNISNMDMKKMIQRMEARYQKRELINELEKAVERMPQREFIIVYNNLNKGGCTILTEDEFFREVFPTLTQYDAYHLGASSEFDWHHKYYYHKRIGKGEYISSNNPKDFGLSPLLAWDLYKFFKGDPEEIRNFIKSIK